ncbi:MAG: hypothetical protein HYV07_18245 [Deltaproteobacteria bacterium]|nr:hypothetical protein [Deltaproteobacteria bacterium]
MKLPSASRDSEPTRQGLSHVDRAVVGEHADDRRLQAALDQAKTELALLREELRLKDARLDAGKRPHYRPAERLAILELRAARGWSLAETARHLLVEPATISDWERSLSRQGRDAFVCPEEPVNRFPAYVTYLAQRLQALCARRGTKKVAQVLARAGHDRAPHARAAYSAQRTAQFRGHSRHGHHGGHRRRCGSGQFESRPHRGGRSRCQASARSGDGTRNDAFGSERLRGI